MGKSNTFCNDLLKLIFNGTPIANIADNAATSALTTLYIALHSADPGAGGSQSTNEIAYTGYARVPVTRDSSGWTVASAQSTSPVATVAFPACTGGSATATHGSIGVASGGATKILYSGPITPNISISTGVTPELTIGSTVTES